MSQDNSALPESSPLTTESAAALFANLGAPEPELERKPEPVEETADDPVLELEPEAEAPEDRIPM